MELLVHELDGRNNVETQRLKMYQIEAFVVRLPPNPLYSRKNALLHPERVSDLLEAGP
jgi:hypothetical protein